MNGITYNYLLMNCLKKWPVLCGLSGLLLAQTLPAAPLNFYINNDVVNNAPNIDATNFINNNFFSAGSLYETTDTLNYTNNDTMSGGIGFRFDTFSGSTRSMASSFYNPGSITVGSQLIVTATNLVSPGTMDVGANGLLQLTGQNVDLTRGMFTMEQGGFDGAPFGISGSGDFGVNTNKNWDPGADLTANTATSSDPNVFTVINSQSYLNIQGPMSNQVIRAVFIQNENPNAPDNVYFNSANAGLGAGNATIEWMGTSVDPATGITTTNFLYLNNDYVLGASTNVTFIGGIPSNFTFTEGAKNTQLTNAVMPSFQAFPSGAITNPYSYTLAQLIPTSVATGQTAQNPNGSPTNLPARTQISASRELNLALATITGQNYLSLTSTNQFDGNVGAQIVSPISDINLGVTNGVLTVSNLLQSVLPVWTGTVQAWSTEWFFIDTNGAFTGVTNGTIDFRVMIVQSDVSYGTASPQVQNLTLHSTNLVISDVLNVMNNPFIDAQSLTLTANTGFPTNGAGSRDGELNFESGSTLFDSSFPNLLWLTNNGAITMGNAGNFGGPAPANYQAFVNNGLVSDQGSTIFASYFGNGKGGDVENGSGSFLLQSQTAILTNSIINANGDISITTDSLVASNAVLQAGRSLTLQATNLLTDTGVNNGNTWTVGASSLVGLNLPILPAAGDLLGTTISEVASASKNVANTWAGQDRGVSTSGYLNNAAVGRLILNAVSVPPRSLITFNAADANNAIYVDELSLINNAATLNSTSSNVTSLAISPNMVIYYAQALSNGVSVAAEINHWNNNHLRWVSSYAGHFSSTNIVSGGVTNTVNAALASSSTIDSNGNGIPNASDPTPFFLSSQVNFKLTLTNVPPETVMLSWQSIPQASNYVFYATNLTAPNWTLLTNFITTNLPPSPPVTVTASDIVNPVVPRYYQVRVDPASP